MDSGIGSWVTGRALRDGKRIALIDGTSGRSRTFKQLDDRTNALADALVSSGVTRGDRVALLAMNSPEFVEVVLAVAKLGAITVPINYRLSSREVRYVLDDSGACAMFHSVPLADLANAAREDLDLAAVVSIPAEEDRARGADSAFEDFLRQGSQAAVERDVDGSDVSMIMYTSGTTGFPKGAMLTHDNHLWNAIHTMSMARGITRYDKTLTPAPMFHIGGLGVHTLPLLYVGGTTVTVEAFNPAQVARLMSEEKVTVQFLVASMWTEISRLPEIDSLDFSSLRYALSGGAPIPLPTIDYFNSRGWDFSEGFGMTETSPSCAFLAHENVSEKAGSIGLPLPHVKWRLADDFDMDVETGAVGELLLRGPNVFAGYWNKPAETAEAMRGGWFHTGDLGRADSDGFVTLVDRKKDMIISGGENVYPIEVEQVLHRHDDVADVAVIGVPDPRWGETVVGIVVLNDGATATSAELIAWIRDRLAHFKCPKRLEIVNELPRTATGKVLKRELRQEWAGQGHAVHR